ncbi:hypothetical protein EJB05_33222, partial [Eragrostis curvula]
MHVSLFIYWYLQGYCFPPYLLASSMSSCQPRRFWMGAYGIRNVCHLLLILCKKLPRNLCLNFFSTLYFDARFQSTENMVVPINGYGNAYPILAYSELLFPRWYDHRGLSSGDDTTSETTCTFVATMTGYSDARPIYYVIVCH